MKKFKFILMAALLTLVATSSYAREDNMVNMPGVSLDLLAIYSDGLGVSVDFKISNASQNVYDITFNGTDGLDGWAKSYAVAGDSIARSCYISNIADHNSMDMVTRHRLLPGTTSYGKFKINNVSRDIPTIQSFSIAGLWQANEDNNNHNFRFNAAGPYEIIIPQNTNAPNVYCTIPTLYVALDNVERSNGNVLYHLTLQNAGNSTLDYQPYMGYVKDINGKDNYPFGMIVEGKELGRYNHLKLEPGKPVKCIFGVVGVPQSVKEMDDVIWMIARPEYFISIRGQKIP